MPDQLASTPLIALRALALDLETTGLDSRKARMIEFGAVPIEGGKLLREASISRLVDCGEPIPPVATSVHGIGNADLVGQPAFGAVAPEIEGALAGRVAIGHTVGFDLAILAKERERAGLPPLKVAALDVRVLAQLVSRDLPSYSLEGLAAWLGVEAGERHRALGDAETAARIFLALVPRLREAGVRTLGEALARSKAVSDAIAGAQPVEWSLEGGLAQEPLARLDQYPYRHRISEVMSAPPYVLPPTARLQDALAELARRRFSSVLVGHDLSQASEIGIVTERDIMRALAEKGAAALDLPLAALASRPLITAPAEALIYRAIGRMAGRNIRHLAATGSDGAVVGMVSARDLLKLRSGSAIALGDEVDRATDVASLAAAFAKLPALARALVADSLDARSIALVIAREVGAMTRRAAQLAEAELAAGGEGPAPCPYAVLVLGSAGRGESLLALDQDNALIFAQGDPDGPEDRWFARLGARMCAILHEVGVPLCKGGVMASQPAFRGSEATWRGRIEHWFSRASPEDLLAVDIFFDFRVVHGDQAMGRRLWTAMWDGARHQRGFLRQLAEAAGATGSHVTLFGRLRTDDRGRFDLKLGALKGIVTAARVLAIRHGVLAHGTAERLSGVAAKAEGGGRDLAGLDEDHRLALGLILRRQLADIAEGTSPGNHVAARDLTAEETRDLKAAFGRQAGIATLMRDALGD